MNDLEKQKLYKKLIDTWGEESQIRMCIEEMSELTKELCKYFRYKNFEPDKLENVKKNIIEEVADVIICAEQVKLMFGNEEVDKEILYKLKRVENRVSKFIENKNN